MTKNRLIKALKGMLFIVFLTMLFLLFMYSFTTKAWFTVPILLIIGIVYAIKTAQHMPDDYEDF